MILENVHNASILLLVLCSFFYYIHLKKMERERKFYISTVIYENSAHFFRFGEY